MFTKLRDGFLKWLAFIGVESVLAEGLSISKKRCAGRERSEFRYYLREYNLFLRRYNAGHNEATATLEGLRAEVSAHIQEADIKDSTLDYYHSLLSLETALIRLINRL